MSTDNDAPAFARSYSPLGKLECESKTKLDQDTFELFRRDCAMRGTDASSEQRNLIYERVYGKSYDQMVMERMQHDAQLRAVLRSAKGHIGGPDDAAGAGVHA